MPKKDSGKVLFDKNGNYLKQLKDGDEVVSAEQKRARNNYAKQQQEKKKKEERSKQMRGDDFVKQLISDDFKGLLSGNNSGHALELAVRISYKKGPKGGSLIMSNINGHKPANFNVLCEIFNSHTKKSMSRKSAQGVVSKLEKADFLWTTRPEKREKGEKYEGRIEETIYEINPKFFYKGETENAMYVKFYLKNFRKLTKELTPAEKGFLLDIAPYFHFDQYVLCKNPNEKDVYKLQILNRTTLAKELGKKRDTISDKIRKLMKAGILGEFKSMESSSFYLHPDLVFKKDIEFEDIDYTDKIREQFEINKREAKKQGERYDLFDDLIDE